MGIVTPNPFRPPDLRLDLWKTSGAGTDASPYVLPVAALNAALAVEGTAIFVPPRVFRLSGPIVWTANNCSLIGTGRPSVLRFGAVGATILTIRHAADYLTNENERVGCTIDGITFDGDGLSAFAFEPKNVSNSKFCNLWFVNVALSPLEDTIPGDEITPDQKEYAVRTRRFLCNQCDSWRFDADESDPGQVPRNAMHLGYYHDHPSGLGGDSYCTQCTFTNIYSNRLTGTVNTFGQIFGATFCGSGCERCNRAMYTDGFHCFDMLFLACDMEANPVVTPTDPMVDAEPTHSYFDGSRSTWISCYSGETRLRFPATAYNNRIVGGAWSTIQDDGERNEFDGVETPGYVITGSGYQKGRVVRRARFVAYDTERPHVVAGWGGVGEDQGYTPLVVRNTYDGTGGNVNARSIAMMRVCAYNRANALGSGFGQAGLNPTFFNAEKSGDVIIVAPGTSRVIVGNDANPATAAVHDGVMWVGTQTFEGIKTLAGSGAASPMIAGNGTAPTSINVLANGTGVAAVNLLLSGNFNGFAAMTNDALHFGMLGDYAPTDPAAYTNLATVRVDRLNNEMKTPGALSVSGTLRLPIARINNLFVAASPAYSTLLIDATAGDNYGVLPPVAAVTGRIYFAKRVDASTNAARLYTNGDECQVDNLASGLALGARQGLIVQSDGVKWWILGGINP